MGNTVVKAKAPPVQISTSFQDGVFVQNLGTNPVYIGYDPTVTDASFSGVCQAGGTFTGGSKRAVYLYSNADTPVVYSDDAGANADAGSQTTVAGTVNVGNTPTVVNGGGTVDVSGSSIVPNQNYVNIVNNAAVSLAPNASQRFAGPLLDVSKYQSLMIRFSGSTTPQNFDTLRFLIRWKDPLNNTNFVEEKPAVWATGQSYMIVPVKGPALDLILSADSQNTVTNVGTLDVMVSTLLLPEYFYTFSNLNTLTGYAQAQNSVDPLNSDAIKFNASVSTAGTFSLSGKIAIGSYARKVNGVFILNDSGASGNNLTLEIQTPMPGWPIASSVPYGNTGWGRILTTTLASGSAQTTNFQVELPKAPCVIVLNGKTTLTAGQQSIMSVEMAFERF